VDSPFPCASRLKDRCIKDNAICYDCVYSFHASRRKIFSNVFIEIAFSRGVELSWILDPARIQIFRRNVREEEQSLPSIFILLHTCSTDRTSSRFQLVSAVAAASDDYFCDVTLTDDLKLRISGMTFKDPNVTSAKRNLAIPRDSSFSRKLS